MYASGWAQTSDTTFTSDAPDPASFPEGSLFGAAAMKRTIGLTLLVALGLVATSVAPAVSIGYEDDREFFGDTTIGPDDWVEGNVTITDGTLTVEGMLCRAARMGSAAGLGAG